MRIADALAAVRRLFLDTAPVIYHVEGVTRSVSGRTLTDRRIQAPVIDQ